MDDTEVVPPLQPTRLRPQKDIVLSLSTASAIFDLFRSRDRRKNCAVNWIAILCAGAAYWILGSLWYSKLFNKSWSAAMEQYGVKLRDPSKGALATKMVLTFIANLVAAVVLARLLHQLHVVDVLRGVKIGFALGVAFSATALTINHVWRTPPLILWVIDTSYHVVACVVMGAILSAWR